MSKMFVIVIIHYRHKPSDLVCITLFSEYLVLQRKKLMSILIFLVVPPCGLVDRYKSFEGTYSLHLYGRGGSMFIRKVGIYLQVHMEFQPR
jgi:hypothetical protein